MFFFSMTLLPILRRIQRPTTQGHSSHTKYDSSRQIVTYRIKPLKEVKKKKKINASLENLITKKMNTGPSLYYDGFVSYDFPKIQVCLMQISSGSTLTLKISENFYLHQTKLNLWKIITGEPVIVQTWSSAHFLRYRIL